MKRREFLETIAKANAALLISRHLGFRGDIADRCGPITRESEWEAKQCDARQLVFCEFEVLCVLAWRDKIDSDRYKRLIHLQKMF